VTLTGCIVQNFPSFSKALAVMSQILCVYRHAKHLDHIPLPFALFIFGKLLDVVDNVIACIAKGILPSFRMNLSKV